MTRRPGPVPQAPSSRPDRAGHGDEDAPSGARRPAEMHRPACALPPGHLPTIPLHASPAPAGRTPFHRPRPDGRRSRVIYASRLGWMPWSWSPAGRWRPPPWVSSPSTGRRSTSVGRPPGRPGPPIVAGRQPAVGTADRACRSPVPLGIGDQAGHGPGHAGGRRGRVDRRWTSRPARRARPSATCWPMHPGSAPTRARRWPDPGPAGSTPTPATWSSGGWWPSGRACRSPTTCAKGCSTPWAWPAPCSTPTHRGRAGGRAVRPARRPARAGSRAGRAHPDQCRDPPRGGLRPVRRPRRGAPRLPAVRSLRLGPRRGDPRRQAAALDGDGQLALHLRALRRSPAPSSGSIRWPVSSAPG